MLKLASTLCDYHKLDDLFIFLHRGMFICRQSDDNPNHRIPRLLREHRHVEITRQSLRRPAKLTKSEESRYYKILNQSYSFRR